MWLLELGCWGPNPSSARASGVTWGRFCGQSLPYATSVNTEIIADYS